MIMLRFNDGVNIDTQGSLCVRLLRDGYYVIGKGMCCPVDSREEGRELINVLEKSSKGAK